MNNVYLIGLTGNLGSGKSTVRRMLEQLGALGLDADKLAHAAMRRGTPAWSRIVAEFGIPVLRFDGQVDRQKLGALVFGNPAQLHKLEAILHPAVGELIKATLRETPASVVVVEAIKLVQAGMHLWCDALWVVTTTPEVQVTRVRRDRQMREEDARARLAAQDNVQDQVRLAQVVIDNSRDLETTRQQVEEAFHRTVKLDQARDKRAWLAGVAHPQLPLPAPGDLERDTPQVAAVPQALEAQAPVPEKNPPVEPVPLEVAAAPVQEPAPALAPENVQDMVIEVRRARRTDLEALALTLAKRDQRMDPLSREETLRRLGERGYRIAVGNDRIVALAAWEAENLVAITRDLWAEGPLIAPRALSRLMALIEEDARALVCEVSLILLNPGTPAYVVNEVRASSYTLRELNTLHQLWRQVTEERLQSGDQIWVKPLREGMITKPI